MAEREQAALERLARIGLPLYCGGDRGRYVALTFDDGPGGYTSLALRVLRQARARATFFLVGRNLALWPGLPQQELKLAALGDHTWNHLDLTQLPEERMVTEMRSAQEAIARVARQPVRLFRPPYGAHSAAVDVEAKRLGMVQVIWSIASGDSEGLDWQGIAHRVLSELHTGAIVGMHENRGQTIRALKFVILPALHRLHYTLVTVPELLVLDPPTMAQLRAGSSGCRHGG